MMVTATLQTTMVQDARAIPALTHDEAGELAATEVARVLALLESLTDADWSQPTYCSAWDVRAMTAHLAGACAAFASWAEFRRQMMGNPYLKTEGMMVDGINRRQIEDRADRTPDELIAEFRTVAPKAVRTRYKLPWVLRKLPIPFGPPLGTAPVEYLTDVIYPRDQWMHRYDICAATGKTMVLTPEHDGRMVALIVREAAPRRLGADVPTVELALTGPAGGVYRLGQGAPFCRIELDACEFCLRASARITAEDALARVLVEGDAAAAAGFLAGAEIPF
jgi:uncharacterized protein (TIGR03083 family)